MPSTLTRTAATGSDPQGLSPARPILDLSGPKLRCSYETLVNASEAVGGIEKFVEAVRLKSRVFQDRLADGKVAALSRASFEEIVPLMPTVRRRIGPLLDSRVWEQSHAAIITLIENAHDTTSADHRVGAFCSTLSGFVSPSPTHRAEGGRTSTRFIRDLAAEILHNVMPEHYPLMQRWVWDTNTNSGVIREIWHGDDVDRTVIDVADGYETFLILREELSQFLADNGIFRDMLWHVDLLCAQVYGDYINAQGGAWLKTEFGSDSDPLEHTRRIMGLDRVAGKRAGKDRTIDGAAETVPSEKLLS